MMRLKKEYSKYRLFILDCDGVVWRGENPIESAIEAVEVLREMGRRVVFMTNNATISRNDYSNKFSRMGLYVPPEDIYTSGYGAAQFLKGKYRTTYIIGEEGLKIELESIGIRVKNEAESVVVALDRGVTYTKIAYAAKLIRGGAYFIATNRDPTVPAEEGEIPGAGAIVAAVEVASGRRPDIVIGKPEPYLFKLILRDNPTPKEEILVVGDRIETDILGARNFGVDSLLVLTGVTKREHLKELDIRPTYVVNTLIEIFE
ncbi:MAG: haloacid dehalogenase [Thermoprotei archaeon]|nr:MAG: haloacid dehalogenase [Thermoprotei archaeon]